MNSPRSASFSWKFEIVERLLTVLQEVGTSGDISCSVARVESTVTAVGQTVTDTSRGLFASVTVSAASLVSLIFVFLDCSSLPATRKMQHLLVYT